MSNATPEIEKYAASLLALAQASDSMLVIEKDILSAADLIRNNEDIRSFIADPGIMAEGKINALASILAGKVHPVLIHFLSILQEQNRLADLDAIAKAFRFRVSALIHKAHGRLITARPLLDETIARIEEAAGEALGKKVRLRVVVDPEVIGGVMVQVGDFVLDGTVRHMLSSIHSNLLRPGTAPVKKGK